MFSYELSPSAFADLLDIADYTNRQWGSAQTAKYRDQLERCAEALATGKGHIKNLSHIRPGLRAMRCQHHYVYCLISAESPPLIVALLHESMDLMARIAERLDK
jgi:toxin ParE1/3/4